MKKFIDVLSVLWLAAYVIAAVIVGNKVGAGVPFLMIIIGGSLGTLVLSMIEVHLDERNG